ncbi:S-layer homology domain-containing protein [Paenibacillus sp. Z6-24]
MLTKTIRPWAMLLLSTAILLPVSGLTATTPVHAQSVTATDIQNHWAKSVLTEWQNKGYISGFQDGSLQPDQSVTRSQLAALINKAFGFTSAAPIHYRDVQPSDWYYNDVAIAKAQGYMEGYKDSTFHPDQQVTRQELAVILTSIKKLKSSASASRMKDTANSPAWSKGSIGAVIDNGLMNGDEKGFRPRDTTTRAEAVTVLNRSLQSTGSNNTVYNTAGVYGPASGQQQVSGNVQLHAAGSTLRNMVIEGDLLLGQGIGEGDVLLDHVTIKGTTTVNGGGSHSIHIKDSNLSSMIINKKDGDVRIVTSGSTVIQQTVLQSGSILEEKAASAGNGFTNVIMSSMMPTGARVTMNGRFDAVDISASSLNVQLVTGSIDNLAIAAGTTGNRVDTTSKSSIQSATLNAPATIGGSGTVEKVYIRADGVTITPRVMQTNVDNGITARVGGNTVGLPLTPTNTKKKDSKHDEPAVPVNDPAPTPIADNDPQKTQYLEVQNGQITLPLSAGETLFLSDMDITAAIDGRPVTLENVSYDSMTRTLHFKPLKLTHYYGKVLKLTVAPAADSSRLAYTFQGSVLISGVLGIITDTRDYPVDEMKILFRRGIRTTTGPVEATVVTGMAGDYMIQLPPGIYTGELKKEGFVTTYMTATSLADELNDANAIAIRQGDDDQVRIVLTWDELPEDEDAHLLGPTPDGFSFHTFPSNDTFIYDNELYAELEYDAIAGYGPEAMTIRKRTAGTYTFYIENYSQLHDGGTATLRNSSARVEVYDGASATPVKTYQIPAGAGNERYWHVFDMDITAGQLSFTDRNLLTNTAPLSAYPSPHDANADADQTELYREADRMPDDIVLPYSTAPMQELALADGPPADGITRTVSSVELLTSIDQDTDTGSSVTDNVYLAASETNKGLQLLQYNGSASTAQYEVIVLLKKGDLSLEETVYVDVPNLDTWLNEAAHQAETVIQQHSTDQDVTGLQTALDRKNNLTSAAAVQDKISVLQELNTALQQIK